VIETDEFGRKTFWVWGVVEGVDADGEDHEHPTAIDHFDTEDEMREAYPDLPEVPALSHPYDPELLEAPPTKDEAYAQLPLWERLEDVA